MKRPIEKTPYVFVYGTLMSNFSNNMLLESSTLVDRASTENSYKLVAAGIPYLLEEPGNGYILGEIYKVNEDTLAELDNLEGHPGWYNRKIINAITEIGDRISVWAYFMPKESLTRSVEVIESGDYNDYANIITNIKNQ